MIEGTSAFLETSVGLIAAALLIEAAFGYPNALYRFIRHPVVWIGALVDTLDRWLNRPKWPTAVRRAAGAVAVLLTLCFGSGVAWAVSRALPDSIPGRLVEAALASTFLAQRSLADHVRAVAVPLEEVRLEDARAELGKIVGRDVRALDESAVARAAIESLAENYSDGVIAPAFWGALFGLPGLALYKAANTLDSMIGHRTLRHEAFGWAAARLDDAMNLAPARLTALLLSIASWVRASRALATAVRDAHKHRSPNAGWPEAAMAGALDIRLSGPRTYRGATSHEPWVNEAGKNACAHDIRRALLLYYRSALLFIGLLVLAAVGLAS